MNNNNYNSCDSENIYQLNFIDNSDLYIILKDDKPLAYIKNDIIAYQCLWELARSFKQYYNMSWTTFIKETKNSNIIQIVGYYNFFIISYEYVISTFSLIKIKELDFNNISNLFPKNKDL